NAQRVRESYETVRAFDSANAIETAEVQVICRPSDAHGEAVASGSSRISIGRLEYEDLVYEFVGLGGWMMARILSLTTDGRIAFHAALGEYVNDFNTSVAVKSAWAELAAAP